MNSIFMNDRYTCQSDNTRVMYPHVEIARKEVQVKQELKKAGKEQPRKLNLKPISAQSKQLRQGIVSRMQKSYNTAVTSFNGQMQKMVGLVMLQMVLANFGTIIYGISQEILPIWLEQI